MVNNPEALSSFLAAQENGFYTTIGTRPIAMLLSSAEGPIRRLEDDGDELVLGDFRLHKRFARYRMSAGYPSQVSATSRLRTVPFLIDGRSGVALVVHCFDHGQKTGAPEEVVAGWVPLERATDLERWAAQLNAEMESRLSKKTTLKTLVPIRRSVP